MNVWMIICIALAGLLLLVLVINTIRFRSLQEKADPVVPPVFGVESLSRLSQAITFPTVSFPGQMPPATGAFRDFQSFIDRAYPLVRSNLKKETFASFSLLYTWEGSDPALKPAILMAHMDVVPPGESRLWKHPPFSGENDGTYIWGRGTLDDKNSVISILEATERLLSENWKPERTVYLAFGHDEEVEGRGGAKVVAAALRERGVEAEFVLDEGLTITKGVVPMVRKPVAAIGISEKGYLSVRITVEMEGGHSSIPGKETSVTLLSDTLYKVIHHQMKARISGPVENFIRYIAPEMPLYAKVIFANEWLFKRLILNIYEKSSTGNAAVRTTTAPTILHAGIKENMIPTAAEAVVNFRILPGESSSDVIRHLEKVTDDKRVKLSVVGDVDEPSPVSALDAEGFRKITKTIRQVYPGVIVSPMMMLGESDSRHFTGVSRNIYRFAPEILTAEDIARNHGPNERIRIVDFLRGIGFYYQLIRNMNENA